MSEAPDRRTETRYLLAREQWGARGETWEDKATLQVELIDSGPDRGKVQIAVLSERRRGGRGAAGTVHWDQAAIRLDAAQVERIAAALAKQCGRELRIAVCSECGGFEKSHHQGCSRPEVQRTLAHLARDTDAQLEVARKRVTGGKS